MAETKRVAVLLADGFEEAEAVVFIDIMRRLKIEVDVLSIHDRKPLSSYFKTLISADYLLSEKKFRAVRCGDDAGRSNGHGQFDMQQQSD
ncbi:hypothetical protein OSR51_21310 [Vibrio harveyi]